VAEVIPLISIVIPTFNRPHVILRAVWSALAQTVNRIEEIDGYLTWYLYRQQFNETAKTI
jgi:glycosyl transferase family 2